MKQEIKLEPRIACDCGSDCGEVKSISMDTEKYFNNMCFNLTKFYHFVSVLLNTQNENILCYYNFDWITEDNGKNLPVNSPSKGSNGKASSIPQAFLESPWRKSISSQELIIANGLRLLKFKK